MHLSVGVKSGSQQWGQNESASWQTSSTGICDDPLAITGFGHLPATQPYSTESKVCIQQCRSAHSSVPCRTRLTGYPGSGHPRPASDFHMVLMAFSPFRPSSLELQGVPAPVFRHGFSPKVQAELTGFARPWDSHRQPCAGSRLDLWLDSRV